MRIAIASPELGAGAGVPHYWREIARALSETHEVHMFASAAKRDARDRIHYHSLPSIRAGWCIWHACFYVMARLRFAWEPLFQRDTFDLVMGVGGLTPFAEVATAHFVHARDMEQQRAHGYPPERSFTRLERLDFGIYSRVLGWLERRYYSRGRARVVAVSHAVQQDLERWEGLPPGTAVVIPNGVDTERFHPRNREQHRAAMRGQLGLTQDDIAVLFVGNAWGRKGLRTVIEAIAGDGMESIRLVVVGQGTPTAFIDGLPGEVVRRIMFVGPKDREVERFYAAADIFLLPTLYEPFGLVILEALASGLPTIVSQRAGASEWLTDGVHAVLLRHPADPTEVRAALHSVVGDEGFAAALSASGRRLAECFEWRHIAEWLLAASAGRPFEKVAQSSAGE